MTRQFKGSGCIICGRNLQHPFLFCSIACKVHDKVSSKVNLRKQHLYKCGSLVELEDGQLTPDLILEQPISLRASSVSGSSSGGANNINCRTLVCTATSEFVKKKRSAIAVSRTPYRPTCSPASEVAPTMNRRKCTPHRSPMY
ncbi:unnamed protein product [Ilex paraguariensis]